ncbi:hypothetical protein [Nocardioides sp.]|uniref:hypothetical protein n=1 Tax=Nocardioides sp. TaxID=35761 RepID=UPI00378342A1
MGANSYIGPIALQLLAGTVHRTRPEEPTVNQYTDRKVFHRLAAKLPAAAPTNSDWVRYSVEGDSAGVAAQRATHCSTYADDPDIAAIAAIPEAAWDPDQPDVGARHGIIWLTLADLHHNAVGNAPVAAFVVVGSTIFFNITLSTTIKHITREDGEDENGVTRLMLGVLNHYPSLRASRFAEDVTRAGRDEVDWAAITGKHKTRAIAMCFGGQRYDPTQRGDWLALSALGMVGGDDDPMRRRKLTGKRLMKYRKGGAAISEDQMPHGWHHQKDQHGRTVVEGDRGILPEADPGLIPVIQSLYAAHADGESYQSLAQRLIDHEATGALRRRDHTNIANTYAATLDDPHASYDAAKSFFVRSSFRPRTIPDGEAIARYLAGEDPAEVFDADSRLYIAKVELLRTGRYFRRLTSDIKGRNVVLDGIPAQYRDDRDEYGWFDVLSEPWPWPRSGDGDEVARFGVSDETCRKVAARLLAELREPKAPTGGRAHRHSTRRALQRFDNWLAEPGLPGARYDDEATQWGVEARCNNSGKANFVVLFRRASSGIGTRSGRSWSYFGPGECKPDHTAATASLSELCASVSVKLDGAVRDVLEGDAVATLSEVPRSEPVIDPTAVWRHKLTAKQAELDLLAKEAKGHRAMAALAAGEGDEREAAEYATQARETATRADALTVEIARLEDRIQTASATSSPSGRDDQGDVSVAAYLVVGLERASMENGNGAARLGELCDDMLVDWRFVPQGEDLAWSCNALIPLASGSQARLPLAGLIRNVRTRTGKSLANTETVVRYLFEEGRDLTDVAAILDVSRKSLLTRRVMPWLVGKDVTARGAKCALVDHPIPQVRRDLYSWLTRAPHALEAIASEYSARLRMTYVDPDLAWGDAAVPDDTTWIAEALRMLTADTDTRRNGIAVLDLALALGQTEADVRELVKPQKRSGGFTRPRYLTYTNRHKTHVKAIGCPHDRCRGRRYADHVVLLPEVAASGYGVICRHCRRTPAVAEAWSRTQYPKTYLDDFTGRRTPGGLRAETQTRRSAN